MKHESNSDRFPERKIREPHENLIVFSCNTPEERYRERRRTILVLCAFLYFLALLVAMPYGMGDMVLKYATPVVLAAFALERLYLSKTDKRGRERDGE